MATPSEAQSPIPAGTKRIIIFDTNAYRVLTAKHTLVAGGKLKAVEMAPGMVRIPEDNLAAYVKGLLRV